MPKLKDQLECLENSAENRLYEMTKGLPIDKFKCSCGKIEDLGNAIPSSSNPYSMPMCGGCAK